VCTLLSTINNNFRQIEDVLNNHWKAKGDRGSLCSLCARIIDILIYGLVISSQILKCKRKLTF